MAEMNQNMIEEASFQNLNEENDEQYESIDDKLNEKEDEREEQKKEENIKK